MTKQETERVTAALQRAYDLVRLCDQRDCISGGHAVREHTLDLIQLAILYATRPPRKRKPASTVERARPARKART